HLAYGRRYVVLIRPGTKANIRPGKDLVLPRQFLEPLGRFHLGQLRWQVKFWETHLLWYGGEHLIDIIEADGRKHFLSIFGCMRIEGHGVRIALTRHPALFVRISRRAKSRGAEFRSYWQLL